MKAVLIYISKLLLPDNRSLSVHDIPGVGLIHVFTTGAMLVFLLFSGSPGSVKAAKINDSAGFTSYRAGWHKIISKPKKKNFEPNSGNSLQLKTNTIAGFNNLSEREIS